MKVAIHTLGCKVNQYESEAIKGRFIEAGNKIVDEEDFADVYIINTCTVTSLADRKSRQYIRKMKRKNPDSTVVVTGCYAQVSADEVAKIEGVNLIIGNNNKNKIVDLVKEHIDIKNQEINEEIPIEFYIIPTNEIKEFEEWGTTTFMDSRTRAYIKIQEGCNRFCSYCIIPYARGGLRSRGEEEIINECKELLNKGFKELVLTGINTALYEDLESLLWKIDGLHGDFRIRLSSLEPTVINKEYIKKIFRFEKLCHHLHLSLQAGSNNVLKKMNRRYTAEEYIDIVKSLKEFDSLYGITTDIIVGFPGEGEEDFADTINIVENAGFCRVHPFKYSQRKGTPAADMDNQVSGIVKKSRIDRLIEISNNVAKEFAQKNIGEVTRVIFEEEVALDNKIFITGYTDNYLKAYVKIDGISQEKSAGEIIGDIVSVKVIEPFKDGVLVDIL